MSNDLTIGPPVVTINQGNIFMVTDLNGEIAAESELGIFANDTRFLSYYAVYADGQPWELLSSSAIAYYASRFYLINPAIDSEHGLIDPHSLALVIQRQVCTGITEAITITNHSLKRVRFNFEVAMRSDFADIFEVRAHSFKRRGKIHTSWDESNARLIHTYQNDDFVRHFLYRLLQFTSPANMANGRLNFQIDLAAGANWELISRYEMVSTEEIPVFRDSAKEHLDKFQQLQNDWEEHATSLTTSNEEIYRVFRQSVTDMGALRLHENVAGCDDTNSDSWTLAAGVPWYVTLFGRDSLIASLQNMMVNPKFVHGALKRMAELQADEKDNFRDAQPGKIPHEIRYGELAHFNKIPQTPYYGTADATALFLIALHEAWLWSGDHGLFDKYRETIEKCLHWIDQYGDLDGDGFQEYKTYSEKGFENMCWKDSVDSIVYSDGEIVKQPKAVCELQGYVFDAWVRIAEMYEFAGDKATSKKLTIKAAELKRKFNKAFWSEEMQFYALALDKDKKRVDTAASNVGHCMWSGIIAEENAQKVVDRFMQPDFWSGWGVRTLSNRHPSFNPHSYHCGSIWPHDNGIIALGFKKYGFAKEAGKIARDISRAASYFTSNRLPELYAGIQRDPGSFPVQYIGANVPQAWAAGSIFHLIQAILGLQADAPRSALYIDPLLPPWLKDLNLNGMQIGESSVDLKFWQDGEKTLWDASVSGAKLKIEQRKQKI